ncbi:MAG: DMT family transporter [Betaproteobacteria bacterium]|nr:DMT family transporter [Betaproteobacteria bacterium]
MTNNATVGLVAPLRGALWMGGAVLSFSLMAVAVRELLRHMGPFEILFFRTLVSLAMVLAVLPRYGLAVLRTRRIGLHGLRNVLHFGGQYSWVYALAMLPLATVFAIEFTMPVWTAVLAMLILGEHLNRGRVVMLLLGIAGIVVILRPGEGLIQPAAVVMLIGSLAYASTMIATKKLSQSDSSLAVLFYMSLIQTPLSLIPALPHWVTPGVADLPWILAIGMGSFAAHYSMTRAFRLADATLVVPIDFLRLPLIAVIGALFYGEAIDVRIMLGAAVIFAGTYYSIRRESRPRPA